MGQKIADIRDVQSMYRLMDIEPLIDENTGRVALHLGVKEVETTLIQTAYLGKENLHFMTVMPEKVPEELMSSIKQKIAESNHEMLLGSFDISDEKRQVMFRSTILLSGKDRVSMATFHTHVMAGVNAFSTYGGSIQKVLHEEYAFDNKGSKDIMFR
jgi:Uncharacterized conserved protein